MHTAYFRVSFAWGAVSNYEHLGKYYKWKDVDNEEQLSTNITMKKYLRMQTLLKNLNI